MSGMVLAIAIGALSGSPADDDPQRLGAKLSEWIGRLESEELGIRINAASVLIGYGEAGAPAAKALGRRVREDGEPDVRRLSAVALGAIGRKASSTAADLARAAKDDANPSVRVWCARSLALVDSERAKESVERLTDLVRTCQGRDKINAIDGLGHLKRDARSAAEVLKAAAADSDAEVATAAKQALRLVEGK